jgi:hypothetical protein
MISQGLVRTLPKKGFSQAFSGVQDLSLLTHRTQRFQPLPTPLGDPPYHYDLESVIPGIGQRAAAAGKIVFHCVGDTGGVKHPEYQTNVADAMKADLTLPPNQAPSFFYHLGDVVYFNGQISEYYGQFYEPYDGYTAPIISIPGNHDGDPIDSTQVSLDGWVAYFMTAVPHVDPASHDAPRVTMSQPNVYFTLQCPFATIVGLYTNVPEHGSVDSIQQQWLSNEFAKADPKKTLIVALHHPVYSFDNFHSGSPNMANVLDQAINDSRRVPNLVLAAHVHNYQRIERSVAGGIEIPFVVSGNGGYYNLHTLNAAPGAVDPNTSAHLIAADDQNHGYMTLTITANSISGAVTTVNDSTGAASLLEQFSYPAPLQTLPAGATVSL